MLNTYSGATLINQYTHLLLMPPGAGGGPKRQWICNFVSNWTCRYTKKQMQDAIIIWDNEFKGETEQNLSGIDPSAKAAQKEWASTQAENINNVGASIVSLLTESLWIYPMQRRTLLHVGPLWPIRAHMGSIAYGAHIGPRRAHMCRCASAWAHVGPYGAYMGPIWTIWATNGPTWTNSEPKESKLLYMKSI